MLKYFVFVALAYKKRPLCIWCCAFGKSGNIFADEFFFVTFSVSPIFYQIFTCPQWL